MPPSYLAARARWTSFALLVACSFDGTGLDSVGPPSAASTSTTEDPSTTTSGNGPTSAPTTIGPDGSGGDSDSTSTSTTAPVDPSSPTTSTSTSTTTEGETTEPDTTTTTTTTTTTDTSTSTGPDTTTGPMCDDYGTEPNEIEGDADNLGDQVCKAGAKTFQGILNGESDIDWFRFYGKDSNCEGHLTAKIDVTAPDSLEVCMFADCHGNYNTDFDCPGRTSSANSPDGRKGCCGSGSMQYSINCVGTFDESADIYVRLYNAPADACLEYSVAYSYY